MTNEAAAKTPPTLDPDPLRGQSLTIRVLEWPSRQVTLTLSDKNGRPIAEVRSTDHTHTAYPPLNKDEAREWAQALVFRFNSYDMLVEQLARATFEAEHVKEFDEATPAKERINAIADDLEQKIEQAKKQMETLELEYAREQRHRELVAEHRYELEGQLALALARIDRLLDA